MTFTANKVEVNPETAQQWLNMSRGNRRLRQGWVAKLKGDMLEGRFLYNGDRIRFLPDGTLYDGHHRLTACVESGVPIVVDTFVMEEGAKASVDQGASRTASDNFALELGIPNQQAASIAAAARMMVAHDLTNISDWARGAAVGRETERAKLFTYQALEDYLMAHYEELLESSSWVHNNIKKADTLISKSQAVAFVALASRVYGWDNSVDWMQKVLQGYNVEPGTVADHVRSTLMAVSLGQRKMVAQIKLYTVVKGFKSVMAGRSISRADNTVYKPANGKPPRLV